MKFQMIHENYNVADLSRSLTFYQEALGLTEKDASPRMTVPLSLCTWEMILQTLNWN